MSFGSMLCYIVMHKMTVKIVIFVIMHFVICNINLAQKNKNSILHITPY